jgi:hypothetical protein
MIVTSTLHEIQNKLFNFANTAVSTEIGRRWTVDVITICNSIIYYLYSWLALLAIEFITIYSEVCLM